MWVYTICAGIWICFILHWITGSIPKRRFFEVYAGCSISICLTLLIFGLFGWYQKAISPVLQVIGNVLICITVVLSLITFLTFRSKGKPEKGIEETTVLIEGTIFGIIRHPLYLGFSSMGNRSDIGNPIYYFADIRYNSYILCLDGLQKRR